MGLSRTRIVIDPPKPTSTLEVGSATLRGLLNFVLDDKSKLYLADRKHYRLCNTKDLRVFLARDLTDQIKYVAERMDCDDFAFRLMGQFSVPPWSDLAIGIMWTYAPNAHALLCYVSDDRKLYYLEPQNDQIRSSIIPQYGSGIRLIMM